MLPPANRLRRPPEFTAAVRQGRRAGRGSVVVHFLAPSADSPAGTPGTWGTHVPPPRVGFVVAKAVGPAVVRNLVKRRLRHIVRTRTGLLPAGALLVVRASPSAAGAGAAALADDVDAALARVLKSPAAKRAT